MSIEIVDEVVKDYHGSEPLKYMINKVESLSSHHSEFIKVKDRTISYPLDTVPFSESDLEDVPASQIEHHKKRHSLGHRKVKEGDKELIVKSLYPPIILKLPAPSLANSFSRKPTQKDLESAEKLHERDLSYFKYHGNNAFLFIHGFNVPLGSYRHQIVGFKKTIVKEPINKKLREIEDIWHVTSHKDLVEDDQKKYEVEVLRPIYNHSDRTIYSGTSVLKKAFPEYEFTQSHYGLMDEGTDDDYSPMNGSDAHLWFIHMEHNLNMATQQFKLGDYTKYTRLLNVSWPGDIGVLNYMGSEPNATHAGYFLVPVLKQLIDAGIEVNILAHSMGNRVAFTTLNELGNDKDSKYHNAINHVFSWQAALPSSVLSQNKSLDKSARKNCYFPHLMQATKKLTVLYNENDLETLKIGYHFANRWNDYTNLSLDEVKEDETLEHYRERVVADAEVGKITMWQKIYYLNHSREILSNPTNKVKTFKALGLVGPDPDGQDTPLQNLIKSGRIIPAKMTPYASGHSYMKVPNQDVMDYGYKQYILNQKYGITKFGPYDGSQFQQAETKPK